MNSDSWSSWRATALVSMRAEGLPVELVVAASGDVVELLLDRDPDVRDRRDVRPRLRRAGCAVRRRARARPAAGRRSSGSPARRRRRRWRHRWRRRWRRRMPRGRWCRLGHGGSPAIRRPSSCQLETRYAATTTRAGRQPGGVRRRERHLHGPVAAAALGVHVAEAELDLLHHRLLAAAVMLDEQAAAGLVDAPPEPGPRDVAGVLGVRLGAHAEQQVAVAAGQRVAHVADPAAGRDHRRQGHQVEVRDPGRLQGMVERRQERAARTGSGPDARCRARPGQTVTSGARAGSRRSWPWGLCHRGLPLAVTCAPPR